MKFIPAVLTVVMVSLVALAFVVPDKLDLLARLNSTESKQFAHYEALYSELELKSVEAETLRLNELKSPIVILNFWAAWCRPCLEEFPSLVELRKTFPPEQLSIIGINSDEEDQLKQIAKAKEEHHLNFTIVPDQAGDLLNRFMINTLPVTIIFKNGSVHSVSHEKKDFMAEELLDLVRKANNQ